MISAKEAREKTEQIYQNGVAEEMERIERAINEAINKGEFEAYIDGYISKPTVQALEGLGYTVVSDYHYNEYFVRIKWHKKESIAC